MITFPTFALPGCAGASTATLGLYLGLRLADAQRTIVVYSDDPHPGFANRQITTLPRSRYGSTPATDVAIFDGSDTARPRSLGELAGLVKRLEWPRIALPIVDGAPRSRPMLTYLLNDPKTPAVVLRRERRTPSTGEVFGRTEVALPELEPETLAFLEFGTEVLGYVARSPWQRWVTQWMEISQRLIDVAALLSVQPTPAHEVNVTSYEH